MQLIFVRATRESSTIIFKNTKLFFMKYFTLKQMEPKFLLVKERIQSLHVSIEYIYVYNKVVDMLNYYVLTTVPPKVFKEHVAIVC